MAFIAEFRVEVPPLANASRAVPEMTCSGEDIVLDDDESARKFVFTARGTQFDAFDRALDADPTVADYTVLERFEQTAYYVVTYATDAPTRGTYHVAVEHDIAYLSIRLRDGTYRIRARVPDRSALAAFRTYCRDNEIPFQLERLYQDSSSGEFAYGLTAAQQDALEVAYEQGYFDSPRETSLNAIADELDVSRQAVADRLRRGHKRLLEATLI